MGLKAYESKPVNVRLATPCFFKMGVPRKMLQQVQHGCENYFFLLLISSPQ
jgi:hypothetical protein